MGFLDRFKKNKEADFCPVHKELIDPDTRELINFSALIPVATFTYEDGRQTRLIRTKVIKHEKEDDTIYLGTGNHVCFEVPYSIPVDKIESMGLLESLARSRAFSNLNPNAYTHLGRFDDQFLQRLPPTPSMLNYVDRNLNPQVQQEMEQRKNQIQREQALRQQRYKQSLHWENDGEYERRRREILEKRKADPSITPIGKNEYRMNDPNTGELIFLKNLEVMSTNIRHHDNSRPTTLYSARVIYKSNLEDAFFINEGSPVSFELTGSIQDVINRRNLQETQKLRELFSESHIQANSDPDRLSFIGRLKDQGRFGFQIEQGTHAVLTFVEEYSKEEKYLPKQKQFIRE